MSCEKCEKEFHCSCEFWEHFAENADDPRHARIDGRHYFIGSAIAPSETNGFGGEWSLIEFNDGRRVATCDLWHNGWIPAGFIKQLPDNARFMR